MEPTHTKEIFISVGLKIISQFFLNGITNVSDFITDAPLSACLPAIRLGNWKEKRKQFEKQGCKAE